MRPCRHRGKLTAILFRDLTKLPRARTDEELLPRMPKDGAPGRHDRPMKGGVFF